MLKGKDVSFEMSVSSSAQTCELNYRGNIVKESLVVIFVTTQLDGKPVPNRPGYCYLDIPYTNAHERCDMYKKLFEEVLRFDKVEIIENPSRD